jgi:hypothetical protein
MKKLLLISSFLLLFVFAFNEAGNAQIYFSTNNVVWRVDDYGALQVRTIEGSDTLYQIDRASILVAGNPDEVLDYWNDLDILDPTTLVSNPTIGDYEVTGTYNNEYSGLPPNVIVGQTVYGWDGEGCILVKFDVMNNESSDLPTIVGLDIIQDIDNTYENDVVFFNESNNIFYNYENTYVGFKILSEPTEAAVGFVWYSGYTDNDTSYYNWLTGGINTDTLVTDPDGGVGIMGTGMQTLTPQEVRTVYMAIAVGTDESSMLTNMGLAEGHYGVITAVDEPAVKSMTYKLAQNYPNPFNPSTIISFSIPERASVTLDVYNLLGQKVTSILNKEMESGSYDINFDASNLSAGIYFYTLRAGSFTSTKKMMLIK